MNITDSPSGKIITMPTGYKTFIPNPLPPELDWNETLTNALSRANFLLGKLAHEGSTLQNPHILTHPFITKEAVLSSQIEGTQTSLSEIFAAERNINIKQNPDDLPADFPRISIDTKFYHKTL